MLLITNTFYHYSTLYVRVRATPIVSSFPLYTHKHVMTPGIRPYARCQLQWWHARGVTPGIRPYARCQTERGGWGASEATVVGLAWWWWAQGTGCDAALRDKACRDELQFNEVMQEVGLEPYGNIDYMGFLKHFRVQEIRNVEKSCVGVLTGLTKRKAIQLRGQLADSNSLTYS